jgi:pyruvate/2-oxoglutarate dehydrogenase complex dihydrolipoamide dehydrogenase (E3) component
VREKAPDAVIVATGALPLIPDIPGIKGENVVTAYQVLAEEVAVGGEAVILGGSLVGLETADFLAMRGRKVTVVELLEEGMEKPSLDQSSGVFMENRLAVKGVFPDNASVHYMLGRLAQQDVPINFAREIREISGNKVSLIWEGKEQIIGPFDTIILALGRVANNKIADDIKDMVSELYVIGDAKEPRGVFEAVHEAAEVARRV